MGQFSAGNGIHTDGIESFRSLAKREYIGARHHYGVKYARRYIDEMSFRRSNRENAASFGALPRQTAMRKSA
jgi:hypothetical protein